MVHILERYHSAMLVNIVSTNDETDTCVFC